MNAEVAGEHSAKNSSLIDTKDSLINGKSICVAVITAVVMIAITVYSSLSVQDSAWYWISFCAIGLAAYINLFRFRYSKIVEIGICLIIPQITFVLLENLTHPFGDITQSVRILELILYYLVFGMILFLSGSTRWTAILGSLMFIFVGMVNYFVLIFRDDPIVPWDVYSIGVAKSVAGGYEYTLSVRACNVLMLVILIWSLAFKMQIKIRSKKQRFVGMIVFFILFAGTVNLTHQYKVESRAAISADLFSPASRQRHNGLILDLVYTSKYLKSKKPNDYSKDAVLRIGEQYQNDSDAAQNIDLENEPNIIVIMNEAFSDLSLLGDFETEPEILKFVSALSENTQKGWMHVSVKGGGTANTEFEFLTNATMKFLAGGSVPYQQYIHSSMPALPGQLASLGYTTVGMHPYFAKGYNREKVYDYLGFEETYFRDSFEGYEEIRSFYSDWASYKKIIERYEAKKQGEKLFVFDVTMQNHSGYTYHSYGNFKEDVVVKNNNSEMLLDTEQYLSLINRSDKAFEQLVDYFANQDEKTVILMFGDHQPAKNITSVLDTGKEYGDWGNDEDCLSASRKENYMVPYIMWANYDFPESRDNETSANYLSVQLLEAIGLPLTGYQSYLKDLSKEIPVVTSRATHSLNESQTDVLLNNYFILEYNLLFDSKNRCSNFFELSSEENQ